MTQRSGRTQQAPCDQSFGQLVMAQQVRDERTFATFLREGVVIQQHADVIDEHVDLAALRLQLRKQCCRIGLQAEVATLAVDAAEAGGCSGAAQFGKLRFAAGHRGDGGAGPRGGEHDVPAESAGTARDEPVLAAVVGVE